MLRLPRPNRGAAEALKACAQSVADSDLRARIFAAEGAIVAASQEFDEAAQRTALHTLGAHDTVNVNVSAAEMSALYTLRMARKGRKGRAIYDELILAPEHGRCPLCGQRNVSTLDHHLPKASFPALAVTPLNLVPSCSDCNKSKLNLVPLSAEDEALHPYFDDLGDDTWLRADVVEVAPAALTFKIVAPGGWSDILSARVGKHFHRMGLPALYASYAGEELVSIRRQLLSIHDAAGSLAVQEHCLSRASSFAATRRNSWQVATYYALGSSAWYCGGGFAAS